MNTEFWEKQAWEVDGSVYKELVKSKSKSLAIFLDYVLGDYYNGVNKYGNQI